jgi:thiol:disulfide interchange protein DsbG
MIRRVLIATALASLCSSLALAATDPVATPAPPAAIAEPTPPALAAPLKGGLTVARKVEGPSGLTGYLMKDESNTYYTFWVTSDGKYMLAGSLLNEAGDNLTAQFQDKYEPKADYTALYAELEKAPYIATGATKPSKIVYAFIDPNCPYCHLLWLGAKPYLSTAGLQIRWIETGFLHDDSMGKAAAIMSASDRVSALNVSQEAFATGGIKPMSQVPDILSAPLKANLSLMHSFGFKGVPGIVYKDEDGSVKTKDGMLKLSEIAKIAGSPVLPESDPSLERFK